MIPLADATADTDPVAVAVRQFGSPDSAGRWHYSTSDVLSCDDHGLLGAVAHVLDAGRLEMSDDARAVTATLCERATSEAVLLESRAAAAIDTLHQRGMRTRVLKGVAAAHVDYEDPTIRQFGDIDLLVRGDEMADAVATFVGLGYTRHFAEPFAGFDEHIGKGVAVEDRSRTVIDLHRTLALGYYGTRLPVTDLWDDPTPFELAGASMYALSPLHRFVHAALHLALSPMRKISNGLDLCTIVRRTPELSASAIIDVAERWGCARPIALAIGATTEWFGDDWAPPGLIDWCNQRTITLADRVVMSTYDGTLANSRLRSAAAVVGLRSAAERRRAMRGLVARGHHERE